MGGEGYDGTNAGFSEGGVAGQNIVNPVALRQAGKDRANRETGCFS